jgi:hypothetical protein
VEKRPFVGLMARTEALERSQYVGKRYQIFADYFQFYVWDAGERPNPPEHFDDEDMQRRIKAAPFVVVIQPVRNMDVPVEIEVALSPPPLVLEAWDHVAEASLELPSGRLEIHECTGGSIDILSVTPGSYRMRACFAGLASLSEDGLDGDDHYHIALWPAPVAPVEVLKYHIEPH